MDRKFLSRRFAGKPLCTYGSTSTFALLVLLRLALRAMHFRGIVDRDRVVGCVRETRDVALDLIDQLKSAA